MKRELSILIPTYNYDAYTLVKAVHTQAIQAQISFEVLVFDDGSENEIGGNEKINTLSFCTYNKFEKNVGRGQIRMQLAEAARYDQLLFMDSDVLPVNDDFIKNYVAALDSNAPVVCGGIRYADNPPAASKMLRYEYGLKRESKSASVRAKEPFIIVAANFMIRKELFISLNTDLSNIYGEDLLLSWNLKKSNTRVLHLDNPVYHLGLEDSENFLAKARSAVENIVRLENQDKIGNDFISLQRAYKKLRGLGCLWLFRWFISIMKGRMLANVLSKQPSMFYFNLLRLSYYAELKRNG